jgi:hypothetical protein
MVDIIIEINMCLKSTYAPSAAFRMFTGRAAPSSVEAARARRTNFV